MKILRPNYSEPKDLREPNKYKFDGVYDIIPKNIN